MPDDDKQCVSQGEGGLALVLPGAAQEPPLLGGKVAVLGLGGRPGRLAERRAQGSVALAHLA